MIKLMLNTHKFNNYAFFCPVSRLHLTVSNPVGYANEVTAAILRAVKAKTVLDVDGVIDLETGTVKGNAEVAPKKEETPAPAPQKPQEAQETPELKNSEPEQTNDEENSDTAQVNPDETVTGDETTESADETQQAEATVEPAAETGDKPKRGGRKAKAE